MKIDRMINGGRVVAESFENLGICRYMFVYGDDRDGVGHVDIGPDGVEAAIRQIEEYAENFLK